MSKKYGLVETRIKAGDGMMAVALVFPAMVQMRGSWGCGVLI
jgi:hypothetical protein